MVLLRYMQARENKAPPGMPAATAVIPWYDPGMKSAAKIAVSLPEKTLRSLERTRKKLKLNRSQAIQQAVTVWLATKESDPRVAEYIRGYQMAPDDPRETKGLVEAWAEGMEPEDWS